MNHPAASYLSRPLLRASAALWVALPLLCSLTGLSEPKHVTFEGASKEFKWPLAELNPTLATNWTPYSFLVLEVRVSSPQSFSLKLYNGETVRAARINFIPGGWMRAAIPLNYYKSAQNTGVDMAAMGNKPRGVFFMGVGRPAGPLDNVQAIGIQMVNPVEKPAFDIRSVDLAVDDPGDALLEGAPLVDEFGQWTGADWPGKAHVLADLKSSWSDEEKELAVATTNYCQFGGYLNSTANATGFFRVERINGKWWFIDPDGHYFFSAGMDCVTTSSGTRIEGRENLFAAMPPPDVTSTGHGRRGPQASFYVWNVLRRFGADWQKPWVDLNVRRLRAWGFNTVGNWSDSAVGEARRVPAVATLGQGWGLESGWMGLPDVYALNWEKMVDETATRQCQPRKDDPWLLGYFIANEPPWPGKESALVDLILQGAPCATQEQLKAFLASAGDTTAHRTEFVYHAFERMLAVIGEAIRRHDPNHLNLGIRFGGKPADDVVRLASTFDVYSQNFYASAPDPKALDKIAELTGRPILVGEFHIGTPGRGLAAGLVQAGDQSQRAVAYQYFVENAAAHASLIGTHWFQWLDQPMTGRMDGENYNIGFIDVTDRSYPELVAAAKETHPRLFDIHSGRKQATTRKAKPAVP